MKKLFIMGILLITLGITMMYREDLVLFYTKNFVKIDKETMLANKNSYYKNDDFLFVQNTNDFTPKNKQDLLNIFYTIINSGKNEFTFYCPDEYEDCITEVKYLANDQSLLSHINNFIHPYNGFKHIETEYDSLGKVSIKIKHTYSESDLELLNEKVAEIENEIYTSDMDLQTKIKVVHDYIINNSKYDSDRSDYNIVKYNSDKANGVLLEGYGLCGGYTDAMAIFLERLGVVNYKIASENHVWNAVLYDNTWYHLDLTWDDPVTSDKSDLLEYNFFLISTTKLHNIENVQHIFSTDIYQEFRTN